MGGLIIGETMRPPPYNALQTLCGVVAAAAPRVATQNPPHTLIKTLEYSIFSEGVQCILRTTGGEPTNGGE